MKTIRRMQLFKPLALVLALCGLLLPGAWPPVATGRAAAVAPPDYKTRLNVLSLNVITGETGNLTDAREWPLHSYGGVSFARPFKVGANRFILLLWKNSGNAAIHEFGMGGQLGATTDFRNLEMGWTSVDFIYGVNTYLVLHNAFTGQVRSYQVYANGRLAADPTVSMAGLIHSLPQRHRGTEAQSV